MDRILLDRSRSRFRPRIEIEGIWEYGMKRVLKGIRVAGVALFGFRMMMQSNDDLAI